MKYNFPQKKIFSTKGTALIITLLVISVVSSMAFSAGRSMISDVRISHELEDSTMAYYMAESGIEQGLLMWRYNHEAETSSNATSSQGEPISLNLNKGRYELKIYHRTDNKEKGSLTRDQAVEYGLPTTLTNLKLEWNFTSISLDPTQQRVEIIPLDVDNQPVAVGKYLSNPGETSWNIDLTNASRLRLKAWGGDINYTLSTSTSDPNVKLDSRVTTIESTGYFGSTKRKLQVQIDRASGTLLELYDFVLFGQTNLSTP